MTTPGGWGVRLRRPASWRTAGLVVLCLFTATLAVGLASARDLQARGLPLDDSMMSDSLLLVWLLGCGLAALTVWRLRWPELLVTLSSVAAVSLPLDPTPALVGWVGVVITRDGWRLFPWLVPTAVATVAATRRDSQGTSADTSLWQMLLTSPGDEGSPLSWAVVAVISSVILGVTTAIGVVLRIVGRNRELAHRDTTHAERLDELQATVDRQAERERIAREVHDALGHRLSLLSLHAGALQTAATSDPQVQQSAALIQDNARRSVLDLQNLLGSLREPGGALSPGSPGLAQIQHLIDDALAAGAPVVGTLSWAHEPHPALGLTAYRVVQELLTNARRHAPGMPVRLTVLARTDVDLEISSVNSLPPGAQPGVSGHGLAGIRERVEAVGGEVRMGVDAEHHAFRVVVRMPWEDRARIEEVAG